jgi:SAM-dependent methyltransferase
MNPSEQRQSQQRDPLRGVVAGDPSHPPMSRGSILIQRLESLVTPPALDLEDSEDRGSSRLASYSMGFADLDIPKLVASLKQGFPDELFIAADIGGYRGTAALDLERVGCDRCFVIDPYDGRTGSSSQLPANRFILRGAENMEGIPEDCFQFIISFNALTYTKDLSRSLTEIFRVLRPGGAAVVDIEWWAKGKDLQTLTNLSLPENVTMHLLVRDREAEKITLAPLQKAIQIVTQEKDNQRLMLGMMLGTGFLIEKKATT